MVRSSIRASVGERRPSTVHLEDEESLKGKLEKVTHSTRQLLFPEILNFGFSSLPSLQIKR